ncbi:phytoene/squalene synthase family protein [Mycolicibacterium sarraceniae]|uniref:Phytoene synthase n=1 Tax=Mycolicibacterium sarraceniae TaxID=1534348 RepID=A0A7I7SL28_9MYCO|nr:phytoene/squalene synthase family protein [Mycolicibacterium sarraceniae]BBY57433.1 phytoene synthase [Mycolicibacterium sarraceniae]
MIHTELAAARIDDPQLREAYRCCRRIAAKHGRTYFLATRLLAPDQRPAVHALYAFARRADDILDEFDSHLDAAARGERLRVLSEQFFGDDDRRDEPVLVAVDHTVARYRISSKLFEDFLTSMRMDLTITDYPNRAALNRYMRGSAEVIGLQMLPVLGTVGDPGDAEPYAAALGQAFQLTNFLRDVDEDLMRNRVYLPADELAAHGVDRELLGWCHDHRRTDPRVRAALAEQHELTKKIYRSAAPGIALLAPRSRPCVTTALTLYSEILDRIEESDFAVFSHRATVGNARRLQVAGGALFRSWRARRAFPGAPPDNRSRGQGHGAA